MFQFITAPNAYTDDNYEFVAEVKVKSYNRSYAEMCDDCKYNI